DYATSDGSAQANVRYQAASGTLTIPAGASTASFDVPIINDSVVNFNQTVHLTLSNPGGGATLGSQNTATLTILDVEKPKTTAGLGTVNAVLQSGLGINALQYAPDGTLVQLLWLDNESQHTSNLTYLRRDFFGTWIPENIPDASGARLSQGGMTS